MQVGVDLSARVEKKEFYAAQMEHDDPRLYLGGEVDRALRVAKPLIVLANLALRRLEKVGGRLGDTGGQGAEIMGRADLDNALLDGLENSRNQHDPDTMTELRMRETQRGDFMQHRVAVVMTERVPASR